MNAPQCYRHLSGVLAVVACLVSPLAAQAATPILSFQASPSSTQAGAHPDVGFSFFVTGRDRAPDPCACSHDARNVAVHLPTGLIGNPHATPQCTIAQFTSDQCPTDSQVGFSEDFFGENVLHGGFVTPVYNLVPPPTQPALFAFETAPLHTPVFINVSARTDSDYGIDSVVSDIDHFVSLEQSRTVIWGVPAAPVHDYLRFNLGQPPLFASANQVCDAEGHPSTDDPATSFQICGFGPVNGFTAAGGSGGPLASNSPEIPFFQNPTSCGVSSLLTSLDVLSYDGGTSHAESTYPATDDCAQLSFNPSQAIAPTTEAADSPSGAEFRLTVPQFESPSVPSPSELKAAEVTLPEGFALAPNVTNGKTTCSSAEARFGTTEEAHCSENAKIGSLTVQTPVLPGPLPGAAYLGEPLPSNRFRMFLVFDGFGVHIKLPGTITPDPQTGQIEIDFQDLPQAPFADFNLHIFGSERGPLATPTRCGTYPVQSIFTPWDGALPEVTSRQFFTVKEGPDGRPCPNGPRPFAPGFRAASAASTAAVHSAFSLNLTRNDGDQNIAGLSLTTPPGFSATLKGIPYCPQSALDQLTSPLYSGASELASPLCAASQVGTVTAGAGAGAHPLYLPGRVYLAGPYKGAPLSFEIAIPAVSGPYDLGNVAVRAAVSVNPETAQVTTVSDPLPQIIGGIPIRTRQILVDLDRPGFTLNPTDCDPFSVDAALSGDEGAEADLSRHFQVANCASLPFAPKLSLKLSGGLDRLGHPAFHVLLQTQPGEANSSTVALTLPSNEQIDNAHFDSICTKVDFARQACPPGSAIGHAEVSTPLLDQPLSGNVYLRSAAQGLPDLVLDLHGQFHIEAVGHIDSVAGGLRTTFKTVPDVPLGTVKLDLRGGSKGLVQNSESICGHHLEARLAISGQNGRRLTHKLALQAPCGKAAKHQRHHRSRADQHRGSER